MSPSQVQMAAARGPGAIPKADDIFSTMPLPAVTSTPAVPEPKAKAAPAQPPVKPKPAPAAKPAERGVTDDDFSHTVVIHLPDLAKLTAPEAWSIDKEGELADFNAHKPFLLDEPEHLWYVASGGVLIFTVAVENGQPAGPRTHFLGI